jgi:PhnB protein
MAERSIIDQLDDAVSALLAEREPVGAEADRALAELVAVARELRGLPSEQFRVTLKQNLGGRENMSTAATSESKSFKRAGFHTVTPYLMVKPAVELVDFVKEAFGAVESLRFGSASGLHCEVKIGDSTVLIVGGPAFDPRPAAMHLYVSDVDDVYARAVAAGATSVAEPSDQQYGERVAAVKDIGGNEWYIAKPFAPTQVPDLHNLAIYFHAVGAPKFIVFLEQAFGAEVIERHQSPEGFVYHAKVRLGDSIVEMGEAHDQWQPMQSSIYMYVEDVDATYRQALSAGATSVSGPADQPYGDRTASINDEFGNVWQLATRLG